MTFADSAPVWMDWILAATMALAALSLGFIGWFRVNDVRGIYVAAIRAMSIAWGFYAGQLAWLLIANGDLVLTWWATTPLLVIAVGTVIAAEQRARAGRLIYTRPRGWRAFFKR